jgi:Protein of unknown function (DUF2439)
MTATIRGTPSLAVAPTQNTAPVFEFRCLYTHDLRKKKKIWHDGSLRFHTFNRRVMVYDDSKNYIGDAHWRETGDFLEGEELRLDKGVMVEVGEQIGHTETDLTPVILEKRRPETALSPPRMTPQMPRVSNAYSSGPRPAATSSQARPKSLAAVLGASQGPIGRARLPARSPFEHRQVNIPRPPEICEGPPAKRPKPATEKADKENRLHNSALVRQVPLPSAEASEAANHSWNLPSPRRQTSLTSKKSVGSAAGSIARPPPIPSRHGSKENTRIQHEAPSVATNVQPPCPSTSNGTARFAQKADDEGIDSAAAFKNTSKHKASPGLLGLQSKRTKNLKVLAVDPVSSSRPLGGAVTAKLRFTKERPRKKLMYKELLLQVGQGKISSRVNDHGNAQKKEDKRERGQAAENRRISGKPMHRESLVINLLSENEEDSPVAQRTPVPGDMGRTYRETLRPSLSALPSASPMFVDESPRSARLTPSQRSLDEDFQPPIHSRSPSQRSVHYERAGVSQRLQKISARDVTMLKDGSAANDLATVQDAIPPAPSKLPLSDRRLLPASAASESPTCVRPPQPPPLSPPKPRVFRRIRSEGDSHLGHETEANRAETRHDAADTAMTTTTTRLPQAPPNRIQARLQSPKKLQRSASDVGYLAQRRRADVPAMAAATTPAVEACFEPWSELEAYLLFDWWPPGRNKPVFGPE